VEPVGTTVTQQTERMAADLVVADVVHLVLHLQLVDLVDRVLSLFNTLLLPSQIIMVEFPLGLL
jgi:hypothetical protein